MNDVLPKVLVQRAGKRFTKYEDTPMLVTSAMRIRSKTHRSKLWAVRDVSFEVGPGECVGVIGRNGAGKSTLLQMLAGVTAPTVGRVAVRGRIAPLISVGVGFHAELTGRENVYVNGIVLGLTRAEIDRRFDEIVAFSEIEEFIDTPVKFYSSGMFVRLGFAVSVLADPDVMLVDEVLAVGDIAFQMKCADRMTAIREGGATILVVSHNLNAIRQMCDRTLVMDHGSLVHDGDTTEAIGLFHDLLSEPREHDDKVNHLRSGELEVEPAGEVMGVELLGPDGQTTAHIDAGDQLTISLTVHFTADAAGLILGIAVHNQAGVPVYGDSLPWRTDRRVSAGEVVRLSARITAQLAGGSYTVQLGLVDQRGVHRTRVHQPMLFYVKGRDYVSGTSDLGADFEITRAGPDSQRPDPHGGATCSPSSSRSPGSSPGNAIQT